MSVRRLAVTIDRIARDNITRLKYKPDPHRWQPHPFAQTQFLQVIELSRLPEPLSGGKDLEKQEEKIVFDLSPSGSFSVQLSTQTLPGMPSGSR